ncbi:glycosyltransferase [Pseudidiomarina sp. YC-516-91]|uniref:glycosyltransferase n=1 Tax=Pseudidiomarina salilacus TaxID=3384452 RepID=UPI003985032D
MSDPEVKKPKLLLLVTVPDSLIFFEKQLKSLSHIFDVTVSCAHDSNVSTFIESEGVNYIPLFINRQFSPLHDVRTVYELCKIIQSVQPDILHVNTPKASLLGLIAGFLMRVKVRLYVCHGFAHHSRQSLAAQKFFKTLERIRCLLSTHVLSVSSSLRDELSKLSGSKKVDLIHNGSINGVELDGVAKTFQLAPTYNPSPNSIEPFRLLFVGRVTKDKGINELFRSFEELFSEGINIALQVVGKIENTYYIDEIEQMSRKYPGNFSYLGFLDDPLPIMSKNHLLVFPSYREGFGMVIIEAASVNLPSLAFRNLGTTSIIESGINGFLTPEQTSCDLTSIIRSLIRNPEEFNKVKSNLADLASRYERERVIAATKVYLEQLLRY